MTRRAVVTGGTRGIGKAISLELQKEGYSVLAVYAGNEEHARQLEQESGIKTLKLNVSDFNQCQEGIVKIEEYLGGNVEVLVNNAGITRDSMMHKMSYQQWKDVIETNLCSVFNMTRAVIQKMRDNKYGRIISMSSVNAHGMAGQTNYSATKAGIEGFTKSLALESAKVGVTVNAIAPGYVNTEMVAAIPKDILDGIISKVPVGRLATVDDIARAITFLAHEKSSFITGVVLPINGGLRLY
ncbi:acetoacetyl-CoA reductase [Rickettsiales endosymbiont of Peranema trichophorum]|uniref:acetoacetyl-CoA reductase n=1 Tax=Rickettsiales endosymbiont of Peranema trichophorum TaxID=2486577 RepID=UPI00102334A3|nr:acetoacetyl-CoA reductase [Rickettsiales endosymbiont of Peranema trichophorum]RZI45161.1 acetoacetyl-CoA reductase [Rickettsiales endosymbiont of Peranema trichophorum]